MGKRMTTLRQCMFEAFIDGDRVKLRHDPNRGIAVVVGHKERNGRAFALLRWKYTDEDNDAYFKMWRRKRPDRESHYTQWVPDDQLMLAENVASRIVRS